MQTSDIFVKSGLYNPFPISNKSEATSIITFDGTIDCHCPNCKDDSTFTCANRYNAGSVKVGSTYEKMFICARNSSHTISFFIMYISESSLIKVGQYPSLADLEDGCFNKYKAIIGKEKVVELNRALGLFSHGIGIGSFVYLRRTFEYLVEIAHQEAESIADWDEETYRKAKMVERIELLRKLLPSVLVETKGIYGILSKGIHELTEDECKQYFPVMKTGIELILEEKLAVKEMARKTDEFKKSINAIQAQIKSNS